MTSVGYAWAVMKGRASGDREKAKSFLKEKYSNSSGLLQNRSESRNKSKTRKRPIKMGQRVQ